MEVRAKKDLTLQSSPSTAIKWLKHLGRFRWERRKPGLRDELTGEREKLLRKPVDVVHGRLHVSRLKQSKTERTAHNASRYFASNSTTKCNKKADALSKIASKGRRRPTTMDDTRICESLQEILRRIKKEGQEGSRKRPSVQHAFRPEIRGCHRNPNRILWHTMHMLAQELALGNAMTVHKYPVLVPRIARELDPITFSMALYKWGIDISGLSGRSGKVKILNLSLSTLSLMDEAHYRRCNPPGNQVKQFVWGQHCLQIGLTRWRIISDMGKNRRLGAGIKARLDEAHDWIEEFRTPRPMGPPNNDSSQANREKTPFSLTYGTEAVSRAAILVLAADEASDALKGPTANLDQVGRSSKLSDAWK
ncbi:hypothetical protein Tco_0773445 [Tanacetum coccineum]|uniref:Uncharacterized protein n=1 Tax=Tanacetum coccineum TaxID=301880 RepID=A0ABQ4ZKX0_9ASTR